MKRAVWSILLGAGLAACGGSSNSGGGGVPQTVTISGSGTVASPFMFSPTVAFSIPGGSVIVQNNTATAHTFTSEAAQNAYTPGTFGNVSFDQAVAAGAKVTIPIPANALVGSNVWFYCKVHTTMMNQGYVQIVAPGGGGY